MSKSYDDIKVGEVMLIPFKVNKHTIRFNCVVLELRQAYGRNEVKVAPVDGGDDSVWVTEDTALATVR